MLVKVEKYLRKCVNVYKMKSNKQKEECYPERYSQKDMCLNISVGMIKTEGKSVMIGLSVNNLFATKKLCLLWAQC